MIYDFDFTQGFNISDYAVLLRVNAAIEENQLMHSPELLQELCETMDKFCKDDLSLLDIREIPNVVAQFNAELAKAMGNTTSVQHDGQSMQNSPSEDIPKVTTKSLEEYRLTADERKVLDGIFAVCKLYDSLPVQHPMHKQEFASIIHQLQRLVMSRPTSRIEGWVIPDNPNTDLRT